MTFITEVLEEKPNVLIVSQKNNHLVYLLKQHLKKYKAEVFYSSIVPKSLRKFEYCFIINPESLPRTDLKSSTGVKKITYIFLNKDRPELKTNENYKNSLIKIISIVGDKINDNLIDKILWFAFSQAKESFLQLNTPRWALTPKAIWSIPKFQLPAKKKIVSSFFFLFLFFHIAFFVPLLFSSYFFYKAGTYLEQNNSSKSEKYLDIGHLLLSGAKKIYKIPRTTFLIFSITFPDYLFNNADNADLVIQKSLNLQQNVKESLRLFLKKDKSNDEKNLLKLRIKTIKNGISSIGKNVTELNQALPSFSFLHNLKNDLNQYSDLISQFSRLLIYSDSFFANNSEKTYLLLFANNMELRPGGGFIGSFGILRVKDYTLEELKIYDTYDADGQLIAHVEPPDAIRKYLNQPNWFLRDSSFFPDLLTNYAQAKFFLEKEMGFNKFSGAILITTTAVQNILGAFPELYLSDFREKVNQKNFYIKTQYYAEKNFFPGSIQKKNFLGSLTNSILLNLENASPKELAKALKKSLDEKQLAIFVDDPKLETVLDSFYWSGRMIEASCIATNPNCINDYIFPIDANLGLNKVNFFVNRHMSLKISIDKQGNIFHAFSIQFNNDSADVFPGGSYRNFFQLYLPKDVLIKSISKDGSQVTDYQEESDQYKKIRLLIEIKPKAIVELKINYQLETKLSKGRNVYQLIAQKQLGSANSDFEMEFEIPKNAHLLNQNFQALVKDGKIIYNTSLSTDKIFFVELIKE